MKKYKNQIIIASIIFALGILAGFSFRNSENSDKNVFGGSEYNRFQKIRTSTNVRLQTTSTSVLASNSSRFYLSVINDGDYDVYLNYTDPASAGEGFRLNANGGVMEIMPENLFTGAIYGIASGGVSNLTVIEN